MGLIAGNAEQGNGRHRTLFIFSGLLIPSVHR